MVRRRPAPAELPRAVRRLVHRRPVDLRRQRRRRARGDPARVRRARAVPAHPSRRRDASLRRRRRPRRAAGHPRTPRALGRVGDRVVAGVPRGVPPRRHRRALARHRARAVAAAAGAGGGGHRPHGATARRSRSPRSRSASSSRRWSGAGTSPTTSQPVLFVIVLVAVWLTPPGAGLRGRIEPSTWRAVREPRPVPRELARPPRGPGRGRRARRRVVVALALVPVVFSREPHQPRRGRARLRRDRAVARGADGLGGRDQPGPDGVRGGRRRGRCLDHRPARVGPRLRAARRRARRRRGRRRSSGSPCCGGAGSPSRSSRSRSGLATTAWLLSPRIFGEGTRFDWLPPPRVERPDLFGIIDVHSEGALLPPLPRRARARGDRGGRASGAAGAGACSSPSGRTSAPRARSA